MEANVVSKYIFRLPTIRKKSQPKVITRHIGQLQADIMYLVSYGAWTGGYKYALNIIDAHSRFVWCFPLKKLSKVEVKKALVLVINELIDVYHIDKDMISITTDKGIEFHHQSGVHEAVEDFEIGDIALPVKHIVIHPSMGKGRTILCERFNRTLHNMLRKLRFLDPYNRSGDVFLDHINNAVDEYNIRIHSTTKASPVEILTNVKKPAQIIQNVVPTFNDGDAVLVVKKLNIFDKKSSSITYNPELWMVTGQVGWRYTLVDYTDKNIEFEDLYGYNPLGSELLLVKQQDINSFINYEKPKRIVNEIDEEAEEVRRQKLISKEKKNISYPSSSQMSAITPKSSNRKNRVNYAEYQ